MAVPSRCPLLTHWPAATHRRTCTCPYAAPAAPADVDRLLAGKPGFRKLEFTPDMLSDRRDLAELRRRHPRVTFKAVE